MNKFQTSSLRFISIFFCCFSAALLQAGIIPVTSLNDAGAASLRQAVEDATIGDTIQLNIQGVIALDSQIVIQKTLTILGPGPDMLSISGSGKTRILSILETDTVYVEGITFRDGHAEGIAEEGGGAIRNAAGLIVKNCVFTQNEASYGGAIELESFNGGNSFLRVENCGFYFNSATIDVPNLRLAGGAIYADGRMDGQAEIYAINSTFSNNEAMLTGGAVYIVGDKTGGVKLTAINCTFAQNKAEIRCGGIDNSEAEGLRLSNTILADNLGESSRPNWFGTIISEGHNLFGDDGGGFYSILISQPTDLIHVSAALGPLANNGGPILTHSLQCNSPAIDAGVDSLAPTLDLRGQGRVGISDIGAFERNETVDLQITHLGEVGIGSLRQAYLLACPGDTLYLDQVSGIIPLHSSLEINKDISLIGNKLSPLALSGGDSLRMLEIAPQTSVNISWLTLRDGNPALYGGGAIQNKGELHLSHCTLWNNKASSGGAIANYGDGDTARLFLTNCTLSGNEALFLDGGAIDNRPFSHPAYATIRNTTIAWNKAGNKGGGIYQESNEPLTLINTLIANNHAVEGPDFWGFFGAEGNNLFLDASGANMLGGTGGFIIQDPLLDKLGSYGGPTLTHRLQAGSPAIDAGDVVFFDTLDQRGESGLFGTHPDIGAYEYNPATGLFPELDNKTDFVVYPNPGKGVFMLKWEGSKNGYAEVVLFDLQGRRLRKVDLQLISGQIHPLDFSHIPAGIYQLQLKLDEKHQSTRLVIR